MRFFGLLVSFVISVFVYHRGADHENEVGTLVVIDEQEVVPKYDAQRQDAASRVWIDVSFKRVAYLSETPEYVLYRPAMIRLDADGQLYALDTGDQYVKKLNTKGSLLQLYGAGVGDGPGEFKGISDLAIDDKAGLWVLDILSRRLNHFEQDGRFSRSFPVASLGMPKRFVLDDDQHPIIMTHGGSEFLFHEFSKQGERTHSFANLIEDQEKLFIALDGFMRRGDDGFVFAPNRAGHLLKYDFDGVLQYAVETMDDVPYPDIVLTYEEGQLKSFKPAPLTRFSTYDLAISGDEIFCYSFPASSAEERVIDVYNYANGSYSHSFKSPQPFTRFEMTETYFITIDKRGGVTVWER